jgi:hypothetical protein
VLLDGAAVDVHGHVPRPVAGTPDEQDQPDGEQRGHPHQGGQDAAGGQGGPGHDQAAAEPPAPRPLNGIDSSDPIPRGEQDKAQLGCAGPSRSLVAGSRATQEASRNPFTAKTSAVASAARRNA